VSWSCRRCSSSGVERASVSLAQQPDRVDQRRWLGDVEVDAEHPDVDRDDLDAVSAGDEHTVLAVDALDHADGRVDPGQHLLGRRVDVDSGVHAPAGERDLAEHEGGVVLAWERVWREAAPARGA